MRKEITEENYIYLDDHGSTLELIHELKRFVDWEYTGLHSDDAIHFRRTRMETDNEMTTRLRKEQAAAERKRADAQKKLEDARIKAEKAAAIYAAIEERLKTEMSE